MTGAPLPSLQALRQQLAHGVTPGRGDEDSVRRQWWAALATIQEDFLLPQEADEGVWLAAPLPALYEPDLLRRLDGWVWTPAAVGHLLPASAPLLPGGADRGSGRERTLAGEFSRLPLGPDDGTDPLLVVITPGLQVEIGRAHV